MDRPCQLPNPNSFSRNRRNRTVVCWLFALALAWLLSFVVAKPVAAQSEITPSSPCFTSTNLTNLSAGGNRGITNQPVISGNGARVSFWSVNNLGGGNVDGNIEVFVRETGSNSVIQLTDSVGSILGGFNLEPSINTAGNRIAFYSDRDLVAGQNADGNFEIFLAQRANNGTWSIRQITDTQGSANLFPSINAAGDRIAFVSDDSELHNVDQSRVNTERNFEIFLATLPNSGGAQFRQLTNTGEGTTNDQPVINAAGNRIAFTSETGQSAQVFVWDESQNAPAQLTQTDINNQPSISADGTSIVYIATNAQDRSRVVLHTLSADGTESRAEVIVPAATNTTYRSPSISGNGKRVVYVAEQGSGAAIQINVLLYDVNTGLGVPISAIGGGTGEQPAISSDGTRVTFVGVQAVGGSTDNTGSDIYLNECPQSDLALEFVTPPPPTVLAGVDVVYQFRVTNKGPSVAEGAFFRSDLSVLPGLPANVDYLLPPGCSRDANDVLVCPLGDIGINASRVFTFGYDIPSNAGLGNLVSQIEVGANIVDLNPADNVTPRFTTRIFEEAALSLQVTTDRTSIVAGSSDQLTYNLFVTNAGPSQARSARITDTLSIGANFVSVELVQGGGAGANCPAPIGNLVVCELGNLTTGSVTHVRIKVTAAASAPAQLTNVATVRSLTQETNLANNTVTTQTPVERSSDMAITKTAFPSDTVIAGNEITYTLTFTNNGLSDTLDVVVIDTLPLNVTYVRSVLPPGASCTANGNGGIVTCNFPGPLVTGDGHTFDIVAKVGSDAPAGTIINTARVLSGRVDPIPGNDETPPVQTEVVLLADLVVTKSVNEATPDILEPFTYTVRLRNAGPSQATGVLLTDVMSSGLSILSASVSMGNFVTSTNSSGVWDVGTLPVAPVGQEQILTLRVQASAETGGISQRNTATATTTQPEPVPGLPSSAFVDVIPQRADLQVSKRSTPAGAVIAGELLTYTVTITNAGPTLARSVMLTDLLPPNIFLVSVAEPPSRANCSESTTTINCNVGDMANNAVLNYTVVISRERTGLITNTVSVNSPTPDIVPGNNSFDLGVNVNPDVPERLVFTQQPPSGLTADEAFPPVKVELRDRFDNLVHTGPGSSDEIRLSPRTNAPPPCSQGVVGGDAHISGNIIEAVNGVATFDNLRYTEASTIRLLAQDQNPEAGPVGAACSTPVNVNPGSTKQLFITSPEQLVIADDVSKPITVTRTDAAGNLTTEDNAVVELVSSSPSGVFLRDPDLVEIDEVTIFTGTSSSIFYYRDTDAGIHDITVRIGETVISDTQQITIAAAPASKLLVVVAAPTSVTAGVESGDITIARVDEFDNENSTDDTLTVTLESDSPDPGSYEFRDENGNGPLTEVDIVEGSSRVTFTYQDELAGLRRLDFSDPVFGLTGDFITITVEPAPAHRLVFTTTERTVTAGLVSEVIQLAREDEFGNRNFDDANLDITLSSTSTGAPSFTPSNPVTILQGSDHVDFHYSDTLAGVFDLTTSSSVAIEASQEITIVAAAPQKLAVVTNPHTIIAGAASPQITIQRQDTYGNPASDGDDLPVNLDSTSATGAFVPLASLTPIGEITITGTETDASFRYTDTVQGVYEMSFDGPGTFATTQLITVTPSAATKLVFTQNPGSATAGSNSGAFTVERRDAFNNANFAPTSLTITLTTSSPGTTGTPPFFMTTGNSNPVTTVQINANQSTTQFRYNDTLAGSHQLTAAAIGFTSAITTFTINPANAAVLVFLNVPISTTAGVTSTEILTIQQKDLFGNIRPATTARVVSLSTTAPGATARFVNLAGTAAIPSVTIPVGSSTAQFRYYDERAGTPTLTAASSPLLEATQSALIRPAATARVRFVSPPNTITAGEVTLPITIERQDSFGNPTSPNTSLQLELATDSPGPAEFREVDGTTPLPGDNEITITEGMSRTNFTYYDTVRGNPELSVTGTGVAGHTQAQTVEGGTAVRFALSGSPTQIAGTSQQVTITAFDSLDNQADAYTGEQTLRFGGALGPVSNALTGEQPTMTNNESDAIPFGSDTEITFNNGVATVGGSMTLYRPETVVITATDVVANINTGLPEFEVTVSPAARSQVRAETLSNGSGVVVPDAQISAGQTITIYAVSRDQYNNFVGPAADASWLITPTAGVTGADIAPVTNSSYTEFSPAAPGTAIIRPTVGGLASTPTGLIDVVPNAPYAISVELSPDGTGGPLTARDITAGTTLTVYAVTRDNLGNYIGNVAADWSVFDDQEGVSSTSIAPTSNSTYTVFSAVLVGEGRIRAENFSVPNEQPSGLLTVVPAPASSLSLGFSGSTTGIEAGESLKVIIVAHDQYSNVATGYTGPKNLIFTGPMSSTRPVTPPTVVDSGDDPQIVGTPTTLNFADGVAQTSGSIGNMSFYLVESGSVSVSDGTISSNAVNFTVIAGDTDKISIYPPTASIVAGQALGLTLRVEDAFGNVRTSGIGTGVDRLMLFAASPGATAPDSTVATVTSDGNTPVPIGTNTQIDFSGGIANVSGTANGMLRVSAAGTFVITVEDTTNGVDENELEGALTLTVTAGPLDELVWSSPATQINGEIFSNATLTALDQFANPITQYDTVGEEVIIRQSPVTAAEVVLVGAGGVDVLEPTWFVDGVADLGAGDAGLRYTGVAGPITLRAQSESGVTKDLAVTILPGPPTQVTLSGTTPQTAGSAFDVTVTASDLSDNPLPNGTYALTFGGAASSPDGTPPTAGGDAFNAPFNKTFSGGSATVSVLLYDAVSTNLTATISSTVSSPFNVVVNHAPLTELLWEVNGAQVSGEVFTNGMIRALDSYGNPVSNMATPANPVAITVDAPAAGTVTLADANSVLEPNNFVDGVANLVTQGLTYTGDPETVTFIATAQNGTVGEIEIEIVEAGGLQGTAIDAPLVSEEELVTLGTVGDTVWLDENGNGARDGGESGMEGVIVNLFTAEGEFVMADTTDGNGKYLFNGLEAGSYYVEFASVSGYAFTQAQASGGAQSDATVPQIDMGVMVGDQAWNYTAMVPWVASGNAPIGSARSGSEAAAGSEWDEKFVYTLVYTNTDSARDASEVEIRVVLPADSSFVAEESTPGWQCAEDGTCSLALGEVAAGASASTNFVVSRESAQVSVSEPPNLAVRVTQSTAARSALFTLELAETNLAIDAGLVPLVSSLPESVPDVPSADEPAQGWSIFLPTVRTQE